ncbi:MAG: uracil-DNA glycosylase [Clostridia bacterium]|nr:uracil-DNA glycosylase [Clostridia bacterium]
MEKTLQQLRQQCLGCTACPLAQTRTNVVFGTGREDAEILLIGEGPGENEDLTGQPFVGRGGQLLDKMLAAVGLSRKENVYIANMVKCRPPHNRDPLPEEQEQCMTWLRQQTAILRPKIIVCLGRISACRIIDPAFKVTRQHGVFIERKGVWLMGTLHPAALLRNPTQKPAAFADFLALRDKIGECCTHTQLIYQEESV